MIALYSGPLSLFARKVEIALAEKGLGFDRVMVPFTQSEGYRPKDPTVLAVNPKGQVPVLIDGDLALYDSTVILEYLEDAYPAPPLYPRDPADRARCRLLEVFADEVMLAPLRGLMHRSEPDQATERWARAEAGAGEAETRLRQLLGDLGGALADRAYFGSAPGAADIALFMSVLYVQRLGGPPVSEVEALGRWFARLLARPAFAAVFAEIRAADRALSAPVAGAYADPVFAGAQP